jgi:hypothetical protein
VLRKLSLVILLFINFAVLPQSFGEDKVIIDRLSEKEAEDLNIEIPEDVPPGFHTVTVEVYDDNGTVSEKTIEFCKDENGDVQWDNNCPNLKLDDEETTEDSELPVTVDDTLKPYDPMQDSETTKGIQIAAFAILSALTTTKRSDDRERSDEDEGQESLQSVSAGALRLLKDEPGWGDKSRTWQNPLTTRSDALFLRIANFLNGRSPLLTRTAIDGNTIRAVVGGWAVLFLPIGALLGTIAIASVGFESLPPVWSLVAVIMAISIFDAFAGFIAGSIFFLGALLTGHITNRPEFLSAIGVLVLFQRIPSISSTCTKYRRSMGTND